MIRATFLPLTAALAFAMPAAAVAATCDVWAHVNDRDPKGTNLRAAPSAKARVLMRLETYRIAGRDDALPPIVRVIGQRGQWFRISAVEAPIGRNVFKATAWVHGSLLAVQVRGASVLYRGRSTKSGKVHDTGDVEAEGRLLACLGKWVRVRHGETKRTGWLAPGSHCPGAETTCS